ncbi:amidase [Reyranella sp. MMS21-HV4-11]|uniref:Amidase n=1 Tax=Reyranella humidisoli TaxID=2849149 RepID=A0ABS6IRG2_9HYPH|nr:amidase [Reyranella sp. MMS21-HV4-11]MBU8875775.1 amidase [Reyranella sp. MMS21-HV4-11]
MKPITAVEAVAAIEAGTLTSEKLVRDCLDRIAERDDVVKAWVHLDPDQAIAQARAADAASGGLLCGIPVGVKDIIDTYDMPTGHNSPIFEGKVPFGDAACVALCRTENAVIMGKTVTTEFANRHPGATTNPHNPAHTPGGSSSGSAAAVADGHVPLAFGTQTGGSVIRPAAYCGVVGYKPTFGDFNRVGIKMQCHSVDTLGLMARTLEDIALFRAAVLKMPPVRIDRDIGRPRIGVCRSPVWDQAEPETKALIEATATLLSDKGASVVDVYFAPQFTDIIDDHAAITGFESVRNYADERLRNPDKVSDELMSGPMKRGLAVSFERYVAAQRKATAFKAHVDSLFDKVDLLLTPSAPGEAPKGLAATGDPVFNSIWTLAGTPCVTLPAGTGPNGLPLGVQLVGLRHHDDRMLSLAAWVAAHLN